MSRPLRVFLLGFSGSGMLSCGLIAAVSTVEGSRLVAALYGALSLGSVVLFLLLVLFPLSSERR
jgi:hypothetical protein